MSFNPGNVFIQINNPEVDIPRLKNAVRKHFPYLLVTHDWDTHVRQGHWVRVSNNGRDTGFNHRSDIYQQGHYGPLTEVTVDEYCRSGPKNKKLLLIK